DPELSILLLILLEKLVRSAGRLSICPGEGLACCWPVQCLGSSANGANYSLAAEARAALLKPPLKLSRVKVQGVFVPFGNRASDLFDASMDLSIRRPRKQQHDAPVAGGNGFDRSSSWIGVEKFSGLRRPHAPAIAKWLGARYDLLFELFITRRVLAENLGL